MLSNLGLPSLKLTFPLKMGGRPGIPEIPTGNHHFQGLMLAYHQNGGFSMAMLYSFPEFFSTPLNST